MILPKGNLKVIITDHDAIPENDNRARVGGRIFVPPYIVYVRNAAGTFDTHRAFSVEGDLTPKYAISAFPHKWTPTSAHGEHVWLETTGALTLVTTYSPVVAE